MNLFTAFERIQIVGLARKDNETYLALLPLLVGQEAPQRLVVQAAAEGSTLVNVLKAPARPEEAALDVRGAQADVRAGASTADIARAAIRLCRTLKGAPVKLLFRNAVLLVRPVNGAKGFAVTVLTEPKHRADVIAKEFQAALAMSKSRKSMHPHRALLSNNL